MRPPKNPCLPQGFILDQKERDAKVKSILAQLKQMNKEKAKTDYKSLRKKAIQIEDTAYRECLSKREYLNALTSEDSTTTWTDRDRGELAFKIFWQLKSLNRTATESQIIQATLDLAQNEKLIIINQLNTLNPSLPKKTSSRFFESKPSYAQMSLKELMRYEDFKDDPDIQEILKMRS